MSETYTPPAAPEEAQAEISALKADREFAAAIADPWNPRHGQANARWSALHQAAFPDNSGASTAPESSSPAAARQRLDVIKQDREFGQRLINGDVAATKEFEELHRQAFPDEPQPEDAPEGPESVSPPLPLVYDPDTTPEEAHRLQTLARETVANLGLDETTAQTNIRILQTAVSERAYRPMDQAELARMESLLETRWGENYDKQITHAKAALFRAGAGAEWLRQTVLASGPDTAVYALQLLASIGEKGGRK